MSSEDTFNLKRFLAAQEECYSDIIQELKSGRKDGHWMWYIFPQIIGLGSSLNSCFYAIKSRNEALAYINHEILGLRLHDCVAMLLKHKDKDIKNILGNPDNLKLQSSMTLFSCIAPEISEFKEILNAFYGGKPDARTVSLLSKEQEA